ncbi:hypothetical protein IJD44_01670 [bacterium]|nr:hypothetical protein [bacterium]
MEEDISFNPFEEYAIPWETFRKEIFNADGVVKTSQQGYNGDCWLLSAINCLSYCEEGRRLIKEAITKTEDDSYNVYFKGINMTYTIPLEKIEHAYKDSTYSKGDINMLLFELAIEEFRKDIYYKKIEVKEKIPSYAISTTKGFFWENKNNGGRAEQVFFLLSKKPSIIVNSMNGIAKCLEKFQLNREHSVMSVSFQKEMDRKYYSIKDIYNNEIKIQKNHEYAIKEVNYDWITIVNPHNSAESMTIEIYLFGLLEAFVCYCDLKDY